jgi:hypothetical protein
MMLRIAWRSLLTRPVRAAVLAGGFGFGIAVMAELLGVGQVILEQAHAPALQGGGDLVMSGALGSVESARFVMSGVLRTPELARRIAAVSPSKKGRIFLITRDGPVAVSAHGGIPSLERAIGDAEISTVASWADAPGDARWSRPDAGDVLRAMDRFHPVADVPEWTSSWAEWLYFNGRTRDGRLRVYLTFLVGPRASTPGKRVAGVRLQLERAGRPTTYSARGEIDEGSLVADAPDLDIAGNRVRLDGLAYRITLALPGLAGDIVLDASPGRSLPPATIRGEGGWVSGYVVPVLAGTMRAALQIGRERLAFENAVGYHDHNWGFWEGVRWQWGQVAQDEVSVVYGRVFPPAGVADPSRIPGFLAVLGRDGPVGFSTNVTIDESLEAGHIDVHAKGIALELSLTFDANETVPTAPAITGPARGSAMDFLQLGGIYHVSGRVAGRAIEFSASGAAETFRPR